MMDNLRKLDVTPLEAAIDEAQMEALEKERAAVYGAPEDYMERIEIMVDQLVRHRVSGAQAGITVPTGYLSNLVAAASKILRLAYSPHEDGFIDAMNYLRYARRLWQERREKDTPLLP